MSDTIERFMEYECRCGRKHEIKLIYEPPSVTSEEAEEHIEWGIEGAGIKITVEASE